MSGALAWARRSVAHGIIAWMHTSLKDSPAIAPY
jgi:hypothetical protein